MSNSVKKDVSLLMVALYDSTYLDDILLGITSISGARVTILDGITSTENLSQNIPMFAHLIGMTGDQGCKVLFSATTTEQPVTQLLALLDAAGVDFVGRSLGEIFCFKLCEAVLADELDI